VRQTAFWLRWSWRDLKARWIQVAAIALVIALGTGAYAGLTSSIRWRKLSLDASYETLNMYDLRVALPADTYVPRGVLAGVALGNPDIAAAEERLFVPTQVDASTAEQTILVPGLLAGMDLFGGGPHVNGMAVTEGEPLVPGDAGQPVVLLEEHFAAHYDLPESGTVEIAGGTKLEYRGRVLTPEYFTVITAQGSLLAEANFAALFTSIETVQALSGHEGEVNDLVVQLAPGASLAEVRAWLEGGLTAALPGVGFTLMERDDDPAYPILYADVKNDERFFNVFAVLVFVGAVAAAFNLTTRIVESQRREIGIAMSLGVQPLRIAVRPLLVGAEIALLGVAFGIGMGLAVGQLMASVVQSFFPLPEWQTPFQWGVFGSVAVVGFVLPFLATVIPVWRAVRVPPVEAIRTGHLAARGGGLAPLFRWVRLPGGTFSQIPVRNVFRAPRRSTLTGLGIAAAITVMVGFIGSIDSFVATIHRVEDETLGGAPSRYTVGLAGPAAVDGERVEAIETSPVVARSYTSIATAGTLISESETLDVTIDVLDLEGAFWEPTVEDGIALDDEPSIIIAQAAASHLGIGAGDRVALRHPRLEAGGGFSLVDTTVRISGLHPNPFRFFAYMDSRFAWLMGLEGAANAVHIDPVEGATDDEVKRTLAALPGVVSVQPARATTDALNELFDEIVGILRVVQGIVLVLALLIAFNSTAINMDERAREHATMFAFGVPIRTVLRMAIVESVIIGIVATAVGVAAGFLVVGFMINVLIADTLPDLGMVVWVSRQTLLTAVALGIVAVALAPLLTLRKLLRMDIAATLKVLE